MNMDSFSPEELEAAISYGAKALDDPKHVGGAATALSFLLYQMGVIGIPEERIKALAELVEEKRRMWTTCRIPSIWGWRTFS